MNQHQDPDAERSVALQPLALAVLGISVGLFVYESSAVLPQYDDSYITYRYARNFVEGHGLVYNIGEYVEGYTNLLWALLISAGFALGFAAEAVGHWLGVICGCATMLASFAYVRAVVPHDQRWMAVFAPPMLLAFATFVYCSTNGMETPLSLATTTGAFAVYSWSPHLAVFFACTATMTRPDGVLIAAALFLVHLVTSKDPLFDRIRLFVPYALVVVGLTAFRLWYYGSPVPNTFYAKVGGLPLTQGLDWALNFMSQHWLLLLPFVVGMTRPGAWPGTAFIILNLAYFVGTSSTGPRLLLPIIPIVNSIAIIGAAYGMTRSPWVGALLTGCLVAHILGLIGGGLLAAAGFAAAILVGVWKATDGPPAGSRIAGAVGASALVLLVASAFGAESGIKNWNKPLKSSERSRILHRKRGYDRFMVAQVRPRATKLRRAGEVKLLATAAIGAIGYYSRLPIVDLLGLVDPVVARSMDEVPERFKAKIVVGSGHQRSNANYVLSREPDMIVIARKGSDKIQYLPAEVALWEHPDLERCYRWEESATAYLRRQQCLPTETS